jgi:hypothetical protein
MKVLIGCEFSGIVRDAFLARGHNAISCDLLPSERPGPHIRADIFTILDQEWDVLICFWPCKNLASSGARWFATKRDAQLRDIDAFIKLATYPTIPHVAMENPVGVLSSHFRKPDQIIQPWQFGHGQIKATCLWLKNLPLLTPTRTVPGRTPKVYLHPETHNRWKDRSRTLPGIAAAMAKQWT